MTAFVRFNPYGVVPHFYVAVSYKPACGHADVYSLTGIFRA